MRFWALALVLAFTSPDTGQTSATIRRLRRNPGQTNGVALYRGLVSHWRMYESEGETIRLEDDGPAKSTLLAGGGGASFAFAGQVSSYSSHLDGASAYEYNDNPAGNYNPASSWTVRVRFRLDSLASTINIISYGSAFRWGLAYTSAGNYFQFSVRTSDNFTWPVTSLGLVTVQANVWYCAFLSFDATRRRISMSIYPGAMQNFTLPPIAVAKTQQLSVGSVAPGGSLMRFGSTSVGSPGGFLNGNISHFMFYNRLLNGVEEQIIACTDYANFPTYVWEGISAPPAAIPAAPGGLAP